MILQKPIPKELPYKRQKIEEKAEAKETKVITKNNITFGSSRTTKVDKLVLGYDVTN